MDVGGLAPEPAEFDADSQELQAAFAVLQRAFRPGKGRGKGGKPSDATGRPGSPGGAEGTGEGGSVRWPLLEMQRGRAPFRGLPAQGQAQPSPGSFRDWYLAACLGAPAQQSRRVGLRYGLAG
eukprot:8017181-Alexandrium_andersonii.AAC.1